jgi:zinc-binding alcohol dehydrogenase family protein
MKAVAYQQSLPVASDAALLDITLDDPVPSGHDILVEVCAISVNPVDTKIRAGVAPAAGQWKILGWDASGIVRSVGPEVTLFRPGDRVWYAGDISRQGTNAELHLVDERIVGRMPNSLGFADAAALPLTAITAWEMLFDRLALKPGKATTDDRLLVIGAAGGVGSIMTQLARRLTGITVIGTASRPETREWVRELGAHHVIDHSRPLADEIRSLGFADVSHVVSLTNTNQHFEQIVEVLAPQGKFGLIDDPAPFDVTKLKHKSISLHWELMFTRSLYRTADMIAQHHLLTEIGELVDAGVIRTTLGKHYGAINAANLKRAHAHIESGKTRGKLVLENFS